MGATRFNGIKQKGEVGIDENGKIIPVWIQAENEFLEEEINGKNSYTMAENEVDVFLEDFRKKVCFAKQQNNCLAKGLTLLKI